MITYPSTLRIGPQTFSISFVDKLLDVDESTKLNGQISFKNATIKIEKAQSDQLQLITLVHEVIHGIATYATIDLKEKETEQMAYLFTMFFQDNPEFLPMFFKFVEVDLDNIKQIQ